MTSDSLDRRLAAVLSADAVGYGRLMGADEEATVRTLEAHRTRIERLVETFRGRVVDAPGDPRVHSLEELIPFGFKLG